MLTLLMAILMFQSDLVPVFGPEQENMVVLVGGVVPKVAEVVAMMAMVVKVPIEEEKGTFSRSFVILFIMPFI